MKINVKVLFLMVLIGCLTVSAWAQTPNRSSNRNRVGREPVEEGRTLGLLKPILGLGLGAITRPFRPLYDIPSAPVALHRPTSSSSSTLSDPYYGGYPAYGGYSPNYYGAYNYLGGYPAYRPIFGGYHLPFYGGYRPQIYPNYGGNSQYNGYASQRPSYSNTRPQYPSVGQQTGLNSLTATTGTSPTAPLTGSSSLNSGQAAQLVNLLGQIIGQRLRPLLNQGAASSSYIAPRLLQHQRYSSRG